jgi:isoaspartyl peptidase/L-asparaginase-like protein (Ntn-hydrolase superfamily)
VKNPITLARLVMTGTENCFFTGDGADQLAARLGMTLVPNVAMITDTELLQFRARRQASAAPAGLGTGTIGAVAIDAGGHLASATSTGGIPDKIKGRVGDTPMYGAGGYADDTFGAGSATGKGENIMRVFLCKRAVEYMAYGHAAGIAAQAALDELAGRIPNPEAGIIVIDAQGHIGAAHTTAAMPVAWINGDGDTQAAMRPDDVDAGAW